MSRCAELARLLAPAVAIDAPCCAACGSPCCPHGAWIEAELWHSPLVKARSAGGLRFEPAVSERLREQLAAAWQADDEGERQRILEARGVMAAVHTGLSPALALEERVAWAAVMGELDEIEEALASAVKGCWMGPAPALPHGPARPSPAFRPRASGPARARPCACSRHRLATRRPRGLKASRPHGSCQSCRWPGSAYPAAARSSFSARGAARGIALPVPDSEPRLVEVLWQDEDDRLLRMPHAIAGGEAQEIEVGHARVQLVNVLGEPFEVPGFERWAVGWRGYRRLELHHGRREARERVTC